MGIIGNAIRQLYDFFINIFSVLMDWLGRFFNTLFQRLFDFLKMLFTPIFILIAIIYYFVYKVGTVIVLLFQVFVGIGKILLSLVVGIFKTLAGLTYTPSSPQHGTWTSVFNNVVEHGFAFMQLDTIAYLVMFCIWFGTAFIAFGKLSSLRGG